MEEPALVASLGSSHGRHLHRLAWAIDDRPVEHDQELKSIGHEETYPTDKHTHDELRAELVRLADGVASRLRAHGTGARTLTLKVRFAGFTTITRSTTLAGAVSTAHAIVEAVEVLLRGIDPSRVSACSGVSATNFSEPAEQLTLDGCSSNRPHSPARTQR
jgi:DNA polymerase-4